ncbi:MAG TPA: DUF4126 domain-containing protein [Vicinamibacterales bacterium]|nr:DUF4126 domain-containing protein [Vicinamibacterales bacterium]
MAVVPFIVATSFAAGLNVYATVVTLGLLGRAGWVELPGALSSLTNWWVLAGCGVMLAIEFVADKIPVVDLVWNVVQTAVRVPAAAVMAYAAATPLSPNEQLLAGLAGALIAFAAHGGKIAMRTAVSASPEPVTNIVLSFTEDVFAIGLTWFATRHPYLAATLAISALVVIVFAVRWVVRMIARRFRRQATVEILAKS